ncbi:hypothetical protein N7450_007125 [Penicillium hetheringtonii]|uniref:Major facilitator superfamily (MFS) profile domain-containing protein n=1 Tax=Penicillium hetheringtonii TaxID=911720 RepID=A0AAD6GQA5_9EURO|nr:hypothetical protein N7450_007125 [Penicillium hetheringtonii]
MKTTAPTVCLNIGMMLEFLMMGYFVDLWHVANIIGAVALVTLLSVFLLVWGLSMSLAPLSIFAFIHGISAGGSSVTWTGIGQGMGKTDRTIPMGLMIGLMAAGRGIGAVTCGPISESLLTNWAETKSPAFGYGTEFGVLIIFTGVTSMLSALGFNARRLGVI